MPKPAILPCKVEVIFRGKKAVVIGVRRGHKHDRHAGIVYDVRIGQGAQARDYRDIPAYMLKLPEAPAETVAIACGGSAQIISFGKPHATASS